MLVGAVPPGVGVVMPGVVVAVEVVGVGTVAAVVVGAAAPSVVTVLVDAGDCASEPPASFTRAAASTPRDRTAMTAATTRGALQFGDAARRVRAAAPQFRHHSCSGWSGAPHNGQASPGATLGRCTGAAPALGAPAGAAEAPLTSRPSLDG